MTTQFYIELSDMGHKQAAIPATKIHTNEMIN